MKIIQENKGTIGEAYELFLQSIFKSVLDKVANINRMPTSTIRVDMTQISAAHLHGYTRSDFEVSIFISGWVDGGNTLNTLNVLIDVEHAMANNFSDHLKYNMYRTSVDDLAKIIASKIPG